MAMLTAATEHTVSTRQCSTVSPGRSSLPIDGHGDPRIDKIYRIFEELRDHRLAQRRVASGLRDERRRLIAKARRHHQKYLRRVRGQKGWSHSVDLILAQCPYCKRAVGVEAKQRPGNSLHWYFCRLCSHIWCGPSAYQVRSGSRNGVACHESAD